MHSRVSLHTRSFKMLSGFLLTVSLLFSVNVPASDTELPNLDSLSWLLGCWKGNGLGGEIEECWLRSPDNRYTSVFQMVKDGQQNFSEIVMISEFDGKLAMRVKHFDPEFNQWESDKAVGASFPFVEIGANFIQFEGLRYELIDELCHVTLDMKNGDAVQQLKFVFRRN